MKALLLLALLTVPVSAQVSVTATAGTAGPVSYTTLKGVFDAINAGTHQAAVTVAITGDTTETASAVLNASGSGAASYTSVSISPVGGTARTISGSLSGALIKLNGADNVTLDGSLNGTSSRDLILRNTAYQFPTVIALASLGAGLGATHNVIKNCNISTGVPAGVGYGISIGGSTPGTQGPDNDNVTIQNNAITMAPTGIYAAGTSSMSSGGNDNLSISGNSIDFNSTLPAIGIRLGCALNSIVSQNTVSIQTTDYAAPVAISLETGFVSSSVTRNTITKIRNKNVNGYSGRGITVGTGTAASALTIANNLIFGPLPPNPWVRLRPNHREAACLS